MSTAIETLVAKWAEPELDSCPACGAIPCDWVDNPHAREAALTEVVEALRAALVKAREGLSIAAGWARSKPDSGNARDKIKAGLEAIRFALNPRAALEGASHE